MLHEPVVGITPGQTHEVSLPGNWHDGELPAQLPWHTPVPPHAERAP